jgi:hypothetical protein
MLKCEMIDIIYKAGLQAGKGVKWWNRQPMTVVVPVYVRATKMLKWGVVK